MIWVCFSFVIDVNVLPKHTYGLTIPKCFFCALLRCAKRYQEYHQDQWNDKCLSVFLFAQCGPLKAIFASLCLLRYQNQYNIEYGVFAYGVLQKMNLVEKSEQESGYSRDSESLRDPLSLCGYLKLKAILLLSCLAEITETRTIRILACSAYGVLQKNGIW